MDAHPTGGTRTARLRLVAVACVVASAFALPAWASVGAPQIQQPASGEVVAGYERDVVVAGNGAPGDTVSVYEGATLLRTATVGGNGVWSAPIRFSGGQHSIYAIGSGSGGTTAPSPTRTFTVDATQPAAEISRPADHYVFAPHELLQIRGNAGDDRSVHAVRLEYWLLNRRTLEVLADCSGCGTPNATWTHSPTSLQPGYYIVKAFTYDAAGNRSEASQRGFTTALERLPIPRVDQPTLPGAPTVPTITEPNPGQLLPGVGQPIIIGGTGSPGDAVQVIDKRRGTLGIVEVEEDGTWVLSQSLPTGVYNVRVRAADDTGSRSKLSKILRFTVDAGRPNLTVLTEDGTIFTPLDTVTIEGKVFDNYRIAAVKVEYWLLDRLALQEWARCIGCSTTEGIWRDQPELANPGYYYVKVKAFDRAGNVSWTQVTTFVKTV